MLAVTRKKIRALVELFVDGIVRLNHPAEVLPAQQVDRAKQRRDSVRAITGTKDLIPIGPVVPHAVVAEVIHQVVGQCRNYGVVRLFAKRPRVAVSESLVLKPCNPIEESQS